MGIFQRGGGGLACSENILTFSILFLQIRASVRGSGDPSLGQSLDETIRFFDNITGFNDNAKTLRYSRMKDTFAYQNNLCYEYDEFKFDGLTPEQYIEFHQNRPGENCNNVANDFCGECCKEIDREKGTNYCDSICRNSDGDFSRPSIGVVFPKRAATGSNRFDICQKDTCVEAGTLSTFGGASESSNDYGWLRPSLIDDTHYRLAEVDVTDVLAKQGWSLSEPFVVRMIFFYNFVSQFFSYNGWSLTR